jgi:hypothetical protein
VLLCIFVERRYIDVLNPVANQCLCIPDHCKQQVRSFNDNKVKVNDNSY